MDKMHKVMHEYKEGELHSGSKHGPKVTSRAQAIAIGMSEARSQALKRKKEGLKKDYRGVHPLPEHKSMRRNIAKKY